MKKNSTFIVLANTYTSMSRKICVCSAGYFNIFKKGGTLIGKVFSIKK